MSHPTRYLYYMFQSAWLVLPLLTEVWQRGAAMPYMPSISDDGKLAPQSGHQHSNGSPRYLNLIRNETHPAGPSSVMIGRMLQCVCHLILCKENEEIRS